MSDYQRYKRKLGQVTHVAALYDLMGDQKGSVAVVLLVLTCFKSLNHSWLTVLFIYPICTFSD